MPRNFPVAGYPHSLVPADRCLSKRSFPSAQAADAAIAEIDKLGIYRKYHCKHGDHWHITKQPKRSYE